MTSNEFLAALESKFPNATTDSQKAKLLGFTQGRISQWRRSNENLTPKRVAALLRRATEQVRKNALATAIRPIVEHYQIQRVATKHDAGWEILPTKASTHSRNNQLRRILEETRGIYFFYNSQGSVLYGGKTEEQTLWKEINLTFNRD